MALLERDKAGISLHFSYGQKIQPVLARKTAVKVNYYILYLRFLLSHNL